MTWLNTWLLLSNAVFCVLQPTCQCYQLVLYGDARFGHSACLVGHLPDSDDGNCQYHVALHSLAVTVTVASLLAACHILHLLFQVVQPLTICSVTFTCLLGL